MARLLVSPSSLSVIICDRLRYLIFNLIVSAVLFLARFRRWLYIGLPSRWDADLIDRVGTRLNFCIGPPFYKILAAASCRAANQITYLIFNVRLHYICVSVKVKLFFAFFAFF